jgi:hypothetical protein
MDLSGIFAPLMSESMLSRFADTWSQQSAFATIAVNNVAIMSSANLISRVFIV